MTASTAVDRTKPPSTTRRSRIPRHEERITEAKVTPPAIETSCLIARVSSSAENIDTSIQAIRPRGQKSTGDQASGVWPTASRRTMTISATITTAASADCRVAAPTGAPVEPTGKVANTPSGATIGAASTASARSGASGRAM